MLKPIIIVMRVVHSFNHKEVEKEVQNNPGFLLCNKHGGFFSLGAKSNFTKYNGFVIYEEEHFKTLESLHLPGLAPDIIKNKFYSVKRKSSKATETFLLDYSNTLLYMVKDYNGRIEVVLDCRKLYDFDDMGRIYDIREEDGCILIEYTKFFSADLDSVDYKLFMAVKGVDYEKVEKWVPVDYEYDNRRENNPATQFVYHALDFKVEGKADIVITSSTRKEEALRLAHEGFGAKKYIEKSLKTHVTTSAHPEFHLKSKETELAYVASKNSVSHLINSAEGTTGIYAGLPWFHQFWARDEAISAGALIKEGMLRETKKILFRLLENIQEDGRVSNRRPASGLGSADGVGWLFKRISDLIFELDSQNKIHKLLKDEEIAFIKGKLKYSIQHLLKEHTCEGLAYNEGKETWMDTAYGEDTRKGYRIEIQALRLNMYKLMKQLCTLTGNAAKYEKYDDLETVTARKVKEIFFHDYLYDGREDPTIRPNVFLAYYIYPELLTKKEWQKCFDRVLPALWLEWGGISTIDKSNPLFTPEYTGENDKSYHRGDSWFFVNNIAAMSLFDVNNKKYKKYVDKIVEASKKDVLFKGMVGHCSEVSSAKIQKAEGSPVQAWSAATLIELIHVLH